MADVILALGSNLGDQLSFLKKAHDHIGELGDIIAVAPLYRSRAYGYVEQPDFLNTVLQLRTGLQPQELLDHLQNIEKAVGRINRIHWGPREIDLDIILYDQIIFSSDTLTIPHADFHNRMFVLKPLADIAPQLWSPTHHQTVQSLLNKCVDNSIIELVETLWYRDEIEV